MAPSVCLFGLLWISVVYTADGNDHPQASASRSPEPEVPVELRPMMRDSESVQHREHLLPPYLLLPMFRHAPSPSVAKEHFRPASGRRIFPSSLTDILVPQPQHVHVAPVRNGKGVEVWCGYRKVSLRLNAAQIGINGAGDFYLGTCPVSRSAGGYLYFHYDLNECSSSLKVRHHTDSSPERHTCDSRYVK